MDEVIQNKIDELLTLLDEKLRVVNADLNTLQTSFDDLTEERQELEHTISALSSI
jgi:prefoldin subunit 5